MKNAVLFHRVIKSVLVLTFVIPAFANAITTAQKSDHVNKAKEGTVKIEVRCDSIWPGIGTDEE